MNEQEPRKDNTPTPPNAPKPRSPKRSQSVTFWLVLILFLVILYEYAGLNKPKIMETSYTDFYRMVQSGMVLKVQFSEKDVSFQDKSNKQYHTYLATEDPELVKELVAKNIEVKSLKPSKWAAVLIGWLPFILLIAFWIFMMRGMNSGGNKAFSFGKSRARLYEAGKSQVTFKDVAGDEAKEELEEIVQFLKDPRKFQRLGGRIPRGVLLVGRPGTGKTLLAKAVAGEAKVPFYSISGSDFVEMFVGVGAARVRDLFDQAKKNAPCIAFIDEIDAVGRHRGTGLGGGHDEREQTLNQLLVEMDGFEINDSVIIIAATNRPDILDPALMRPGRFDRQVVVDLPDIKGRFEILKVHSARIPLSENVNLQIIARGTPGFSGADLANLVNEAALIAAGKSKKALEMEDFEEAKDKVTLGKERKSKVIEEDEKKLTAFHEVGHVLCSIFQDKTEPVHKVTIIPRGFTGGATHYLLTDKSNYAKSYLDQMLVTMLGGRAAEEIIFGELTTGAGNDIDRATDIAKKMVCSWGMSEKIGPMTIGREQGEIFLGKEIAQRDFYSEETAQMVDTEIRDLINTSHNKAVSILRAHQDTLEKMAIELLEKETLNADEIFNIIFSSIDDETKEMVTKKYEKAKELRFGMEEEMTEESKTPEQPVSTNEQPTHEPSAEDQDNKSDDHSEN
ncbi:MAG TPA: ATP-dependent zinc metalloprotease FtsH [Candidatus Cloacimonadota bacterium]|nr:ATP-dependent zinc metalloprotease FtsH [Candidatus Cloacimonadota bacterium]